jgi:DNA polymerase-3 subunit gamma/tau
MAAKLSMPVLTRTWQMLLKGLEETQRADAQLQAAEMVLVRLAYAADLPSPGDLARELASRPQQQTAAPAPGAGMGGNGSGGGNGHPSAGAPAAAVADPVPVEAASAPPPSKTPQSFLEVLQLFEANREIGIRTQLYNSVHLVKFEPGRIEFRPTDHAPRDLASKTMKFLDQWTGVRWVVTISQEQGDPTLAEQDAAAKQKLLDAAELLPVVQAVKESFPGAIVRKVIPRRDYSDPDSEPEFLEAPEDPEDEDDERI